MKAFYKIIILISLYSLSSSFAQTATAPSGDGSSGNPYQIATWQNLYWITQNSAHWNDYYLQTANIDLNSASPAINTWDSNKGWTPIGNSTTKFTGQYNGQNYTISGLYISRSTTDYQALFGYTNGATISYVGLTNGSISGQNYVGSLVGYCNGGSVSYCYNTGSVTGSSYVIGGLIGNLYSSSLSYSYNSGSASATSGSAWSYLGGLVGQSTYSTISNCYNRGSVSSNYAPVGGLVGYNNTDGGVVTNCYNSGSVSGYTGTIGGLYRLGGLVGDCCSGTVNNSYWDYQTAGTSSSPSGKGTSKTTAQMKTQSTFSGWDFTTVWQISGGDGANYPSLRNNPDSALPVELVSFFGLLTNKHILLKWQTATEVNNYGFSVERRTKSEEWIKIGFVQGHGNSNSPKNYSFTDINPPSGKNLYRLKQIDFDGKFEYSSIIEVSLDIPQQFNLEQNHPNPFNPRTTINYSIPFNGNAKLVVYDVLGREVAKLFDEFKYAGSYRVEFDASYLNSGIYFYKLIYNYQSLTKRMILIK